MFAATIFVIGSAVACGDGGTSSPVATPAGLGLLSSPVVPSETLAVTTTSVSDLLTPTTIATLELPEPTSPPMSSITLAGGPIPDAPPGFCSELAAKSGELVLEVDSVLAEDGTMDPRSQHALLLATRNLLAWTNNRVPMELRADVGLLNRIYADIGIELDRLDAETVTMPRLQALVFGYVRYSPVVDAAELDLSAQRLAAYVDRSCGHGFPVMESMADMFSSSQDSRDSGWD